MTNRGSRVGHVWYPWLREFWLDELLCLYVPWFPHHSCNNNGVVVRILITNPCRKPCTVHSAHERQCVLAVISTISTGYGKSAVSCLPFLLAQCCYPPQLGLGICLYCDSQGSTDRFCPISSSSTVHLPQLELWITGWKWDLKMEKSSIQAKPPWWGYLASWDVFLCIQFSAGTKGSVTVQVSHTRLITGVVREHRSHMTWLWV